jgi:hypothetical protein
VLFPGSRSRSDFKVIEWDSEALNSIEEVRIEGLKVVRDLHLLGGSLRGTDFEGE